MLQHAVQATDRAHLDDPHFTVLNYIANAVHSLQAEGIAHYLGQRRTTAARDSGFKHN